MDFVRGDDDRARSHKMQAFGGNEDLALCHVMFAPNPVVASRGTLPMGL